MKLFKSLTSLTIIFSSIIIVGAGHGGGPLGLLEIFWLPKFFGIGTEDFSFSLTAPYDYSLGAAAMFSFIGHLLLLTSFIVKNTNAKFWIETVGVLFLWFSFYYVVHDFSNTIAKIGFVTGLPFIVVSARLFFKNVNKKLIIFKED